MSDDIAIITGGQIDELELARLQKRLQPFTVQRLIERVLELEFINDYLYEALGPANDDILDMAHEAWRER